MGVWVWVRPYLKPYLFTLFTPISCLVILPPTLSKQGDCIGEQRLCCSRYGGKSGGSISAGSEMHTGEGGGSGGRWSRTRRPAAVPYCSHLTSHPGEITN